jgi:ArsR family transcriptional regulator
VAGKAHERLVRCIEAGMKGKRIRSGEAVDKLQRKLQGMAPDQDAARAARVARAMADPMRVAILTAIGAEGELCVCEIMLVINRSQPTTSHHLGILKEVGLLKESRRGKWVFYSLVDSSILDILRSLRQVGARRR